MLRQYVFSISASAQESNSTSIVHTVGITTGCDVPDAESNALWIARKRWSPMLGWVKHSASVMEVEPTLTIERENERTIS